jgi:hypothetical protein
VHDYDEDNDGRYPDESPVEVRYTVDATGAKITSSRPVALDANFAFIGGRFRGNYMEVEGETRLRHARIGGSSSSAPWRTTAYTVPAEAG